MKRSIWTISELHTIVKPESEKGEKGEKGVLLRSQAVNTLSFMQMNP